MAVEARRYGKGAAKLVEVKKRVSGGEDTAATIDWTKQGIVVDAESLQACMGAGRKSRKDGEEGLIDGEGHGGEASSSEDGDIREEMMRFVADNGALILF